MSLSTFTCAGQPRLLQRGILPLSTHSHGFAVRLTITRQGQDGAA